MRLNQLKALWLAFSLIATSPLAQAVTNEPTRIVIECEDMQGVAQNKFGPGKSWQVGRWGYDLYQNMIFGGVWSSRLRNAMTDETDAPAAATAEFNVSVAGIYKVWTKYECPPFFNYACGVKIETLDGAGATVFDKTYGLREAPKHFCFTDKLTSGDLYWSWGIDHDAAEGYETQLAATCRRKNAKRSGTRCGTPGIALIL